MRRMRKIMMQVSLFLVLFMAGGSIYIQPSASSDFYDLCCSEEGKLETSDDAEELTNSLKNAQAGDEIRIKLLLRNEYVADSDKEIRFYLKVCTDSYDPEKEEYSYSRWKEEQGHVLAEVTNLEDDADDEYYESLVNREQELNRKLDTDTFGKDELTSEEEVFYNAVQKLEISLETEGSSDEKTASGIETDGLIFLGAPAFQEELTCDLCIKINDELSAEELDMIRLMQLRPVMKKTGTNPAVSVRIKIENLPANGSFFVPFRMVEAGTTEEGVVLYEFLDTDSDVQYQVTAVNEGDIPLKLYQICVGNTAYSSGQQLNPGEKKEISGWFSVTDEIAGQGGTDLSVRFEAVLDHPDIKEHLIAEDSEWFPAGFEEETAVSETESAVPQSSSFSTEVTVEEEKKEAASGHSLPFFALLVSGLVIGTAAIVIICMVRKKERK